MLDNVLLSSWAVSYWLEKALAQIDPKIDTVYNPDEDSEVLPYGDLRIFIEHKGVRLAEADIPPTHWRYIQ